MGVVCGGVRIWGEWTHVMRVMCRGGSLWWGTDMG